MLQVFKLIGSSVTDLTAMLQSAIWSGEYRQCCRTMQLELINPSKDARLPQVSLALDENASIEVRLNSKTIFIGRPFSRTYDNGSYTYTVTCYDMGFYLNANKGLYSFSKATPQGIAQRVAADFGIETGELAAPSASITRDFYGVKLYNIIQTAYTLAAEDTGTAYLIRFRGLKMDIIEKKVSEETLLLRTGSNLLSVTTTEDVSKMVNQVVIYDEDGNVLATKSNASDIALYGLMQDALRQQSDTDMDKKAQKLLDDNALTQKITVTVLPSEENQGQLITGNCVILQEKITGLYGSFWIDSDTHNFNKDGTRVCKLVLNFRNLMDEQEAGTKKEA